MKHTSSDIKQSQQLEAVHAYFLHNQDEIGLESKAAKRRKHRKSHRWDFDKARKLVDNILKL